MISIPVMEKFETFCIRFRERLK